MWRTGPVGTAFARRRQGVGGGGKGVVLFYFPSFPLQVPRGKLSKKKFAKPSNVRSWSDTQSHGFLAATPDGFDDAHFRGSLCSCFCCWCAGVWVLSCWPPEDLNLGLRAQLGESSRAVGPLPLNTTTVALCTKLMRTKKQPASEVVRQFTARRHQLLFSVSPVPG